MKLGTRKELFSAYGDGCYLKMKKCGFDYADVSISGELDGMSEAEYEQRWLAEKALADAAGVVIHQTHGPWRFPPHDETEALRAERAEVMKRSIRITAKLGCRYWVIHPLMPFGPNDDFAHEQFIQINYDFFRALLPTAKENGVTICFENMPMKKLSISTPEKTLEFIHLINDEQFRLCLDTGHSMVFGIQPAEAVRMAGDDLKVMHVHDNHGKNDEHLIPYSGIVDWADYRRALDEIGFDGVYSLECGWKDFLPGAADDARADCLTALMKHLTAL